MDCQDGLIHVKQFKPKPTKSSELFTIRDLEAAERAISYTSTTGSYSCWNSEVNLGPPPILKKTPHDDKHIQQYYEALQYTLFETGYPETVDRTDTPRTCYTEHNPALVILSSPVECMCFILEGGRQCPGDMILVLSTTWLTKEPSTDCLYTLYVHKGITSDKGGNTFIDVFDPPRKVTYFVDFFTNACTSFQRGDGEDLENNLECPMSSSVELSKIVDDKLLTRILLYRAGVTYPVTLAFPFSSLIDYDSDIPGITICTLQSNKGVMNMVSAAILKFLSSEPMKQYAKVVVKPSGPNWFGSQLVSVHSRENSRSVLAAAAEVLLRIEKGDAILVESFCEPVPRVKPLLRTSSNRTDIIPLTQLGFRIRACVCRNPEDEAIMTSVTCGVGDAKAPINGDNTVVQGLCETLRSWGITNEEECQQVHADLKWKSEAALNAIMSYEKTLPLVLRGTVGAQTDIIGIDFVLTRENGMLSSVPIEVNSHDCTINNQIYEFINPDISGESVRPLVATMLNRSLKYMMKDRRVLVVGAGGFSKKFVWEAAKDYQIKVYLVDSDKNHFASTMVHEFIQLDISDHTRDIQHATMIADEVKGRQLDLDGCVTFWEDCVPLTAMVCEKLALTGSGLRGSIIAKAKSLTQQVLSTRTEDIPHWPRTHLYSSKTVRVETHVDIENASHILSFPAMMKLEYGSSAVGVSLVDNIHECHQYFDQIQSDLQTEEDHPGVGLGYGNAMLLMDFIQGTEHDVDIVIFRRKLVAAFVSDNGPTKIPNFTETTSTMPTTLTKDKRNQLVVAAYQCCVEIGLESGTFNVELKMTPTGPKLIEINARMGGFYLRDWIKRCYKVDILLCSFAIACGIKPLLTELEPSSHMVGMMLTPKEHRQAFSATNWSLLQTLSNRGLLCLNQFEESYNESQQYAEPFCNIAVIDSEKQRAKTRLIEICNVLGLASKESPFEQWFEDFGLN